MVLDVSKGFLKPGTAVPFEAEAVLPPQDVMGEIVSFENASIRGSYMVVEDSIHLEGTLSITACGHCAMCMREVSVPLQIIFSEVFRKGANEMEEDAFHFQGKEVSLTQMVLTLVMLDLPMRFLCKQECKGSEELQALQQVISKSSCPDGLPTQRPFEALQHLLMKDEEV